MRERVRVASVSVVWIGGLEFSKCDGLEDSFGLRCSIFAIKTNKSPNLAPISPRRHQPSAQPVQDLIYAAHLDFEDQNAFQWIGRWANHLGARRTRVVRMAHVMAAAAGCGSRQQHVVGANEAILALIYKDS